MGMRLRVKIIVLAGRMTMGLEHCLLDDQQGQYMANTGHLDLKGSLSAFGSRVPLTMRAGVPEASLHESLLYTGLVRSGLLELIP